MLFSTPAAEKPRAIVALVLRLIGITLGGWPSVQKENKMEPTIRINVAIGVMKID